MAEFAPNKAVSSATPDIVVDPLPLGTHVFELQVQDNLGQVSAPVQLTVVVFRMITRPQKPDKP